jgi:predicted  nucleic acid-binding Zn-ribbon protein
MTPEIIGGIISILGLLGALIKIWTKVGEIQAQRLEIGLKRDNAESDMRDKIMKAEWEIKYLKDELQFLNTKSEDLSKQVSILTTEITKMSVKFETLIERLDKLTEMK